MSDSTSPAAGSHLGSGASLTPTDSNNPCAKLTNLPNELLLIIAKSLKCADLSSFALACRRLHPTLQNALDGRAFEEESDMLEWAAQSDRRYHVAKRILGLNLPVSYSQYVRAMAVAIDSSQDMLQLLIDHVVPDYHLFRISMTHRGFAKAVEHAVCHGRLGIIRSLVDAQFPETNRLLRFAARYGQVEITKLLLKAGAHVNDASDGGGDTALHRAAFHGNASVVEALIEAGANIEARDKYGRTPLWHATTSGEDSYQTGPGKSLPGNVAVVKLLASHGASGNVISTRGVHLIHVACQCAFMVDTFIALGADVSAPSADGYSPLHCAVTWVQGERWEQGMDALLRAGADVSALDPFGYAVLHRAVLRGNIAMARKLLAAGADPTQPNRDGRTPTHMAALAQQEELFRVLMNAGANVTIRPDYLGFPNLHRAVREQNPCLVELLLRAGADIWELNEQGKTPLDIANGYYSDNSVKLLLANEIARQQGQRPHL